MISEDKVLDITKMFSNSPTFILPEKLNPTLIKSCPFCGSQARVVPRTFGDSCRSYYRVQCSSNGYHSLDCWDDSEVEAIQTWNERPKD